MVKHMHATSVKVVAVLLALAVPAAAHACLCMNMPQRTAQRDDSHSCCNKDAVKKARQSQSDDPCKDCNLRERQTMTVAQKDASFQAADFDLLIPTVHILIKSQLSTFASSADVPIPPLLQDLLHTHCQLTV